MNESTHQSETPRTDNRRRRILIDRPVQGRIILNMSWPPAVALGMTAVILGIFSKRLLEEALEAQIELPSLVPILWTIVAFLLVSVGYLLFSALKFSHRIAGPAYRLLRTLESARGGDLSARANLRSGDFLVDVADSLNEFLTQIEFHGLPVARDADGDAGSDADAGAGAGADADADMSTTDTEAEQGELATGPQGMARRPGSCGGSTGVEAGEASTPDGAGASAGPTLAATPSARQDR